MGWLDNKVCDSESRGDKLTDKDIAELIKRRRYQILVHSYLYYDRDINLITDDTFDKWGRELVTLQTKFPEVAKQVEWHDAFVNWDAGSGAFLPYRHPKIVSIACHLIKDYSQVVIEKPTANQVKIENRSSKKPKKSKLF